jgi:hypothetical protein
VLWVIVVLAVLVLVLLALLLFLWRDRHAGGAGGHGGDGGADDGDESPVVDPDDLIPSTLDEATLPGYLAVRLRGQPSSVDVAALAAGGTAVIDDAAAPAQVVWVNGGDEALVHLDSLTTTITGSTLVVSLDLETDQTGRAPVIVRLSLGDRTDPAGLVATADRIANGHPLLVSRWGDAVTAAVWSGLVGLGVDHADERGGVPGRIAIDRDRLVLHARAPITLQRDALTGT